MYYNSYVRKTISFQWLQRLTELKQVSEETLS